MVENIENFREISFAKQFQYVAQIVENQHFVKELEIFDVPEIFSQELQKVEVIFNDNSKSTFYGFDALYLKRNIR